jgi:hypothetical protein
VPRRAKWFQHNSKIPNRRVNTGGGGGGGGGGGFNGRKTAGNAAAKITGLGQSGTVRGQHNQPCRNHGGVRYNNYQRQGAIDKEGTARTIVDTLNNSYYRGTGGASNLVRLIAMTQWNPVWKVEIDGVEYTSRRFGKPDNSQRSNKYL